MKIGLTLIAIALSGLITGLAFATPLMLSELDVKPWIHHIQGPTADFEIEIIFANFTVLNPNEPTSEADDLSVKYQVWLNVTNPSGLGATLLDVNFAAAGEITAYSGPPLIGANSSGGWGWEAEGALVDDKWYNLTWVNGTYPFFDRDGNMEPSPFEIPWQTGYWMEGVQLYQRHVNGTIVATYLNMNGTWTDVTDRIVLEERDHGSGHSLKDVVADQLRIFQKYVPDASNASVVFDSDGNEIQVPSVIDVGNGTEVTVSVDSLSGTIYIQAGEGYFNNYWKPGESRIVLIEGSQKFGSWVNFNPVGVLSSGTITFKTITFNSADTDFWLGNNTVQDNWSYANELKTIELTKENNSYIYNMALVEKYKFSVDEWNAEVFLEPR
jgi:hypothetical protein